MHRRSQSHDSDDDKTDWNKFIKLRLNQTSMKNPSDDVLEESLLEQIRTYCASTMRNNIYNMNKTFEKLEDEGLAVKMENCKVLREDQRLGVTPIHNYSLLRCNKRLLNDTYKCQTSGYMLNFNSTVCIMSTSKCKNHKQIKKLFYNKKLQDCNPLDLHDILKTAEEDKVLVKGRVIETDAESLAIVFFCRADKLQAIVDEKSCFIIQHIDANIERKITSLIRHYKSKNKSQSLLNNINRFINDLPLDQGKPVDMENEFKFLKPVEPSPAPQTEPDQPGSNQLNEKPPEDIPQEPKEPEQVDVNREVATFEIETLVPWDLEWQAKQLEMQIDFFNQMLIQPPIQPTPPLDEYQNEDMDEDQYHYDHHDRSDRNRPPVKENRNAPSSISNRQNETEDLDSSSDRIIVKPPTPIPAIKPLPAPPQQKPIEVPKMPEKNRPPPQEPEIEDKIEQISPKQVPYNWFKTLNQRQQDAVKNSLGCDHFYLIQGPPGTGKSTTLLAIIDAIWKEDKSVMIVTQSDAALDHLLKSYANIGVKKKKSIRSPAEKKELIQRIQKRQSSICRFGYKWSVANSCKKYLFEDLVTKRYAESFDKNIPNEANKRRIVKEIQSMMRVVFTPLEAFYHKIHSNYLKDMKFDYCIFDEACQCRISESMMPLESVDKVIYAGDHKQLGVMANHPKASKDAKLSLFEKMLLKKDKLPPGSKEVFSMLNIQFRMNSELMDISRSIFYDDLLLDDEKAKSICLKDFEKVTRGSGLIPLDRPLMWIDNTLFESQPRKGQFINVYEQMIVARLLIELVCNMGVLPDQIGVICGYNNQRNFIVSLLNHVARHEKDKDRLKEIKVSTVDAFQGQEKEVIILATTRSNEKLSIGFLDEPKRFNVSVTRARRLLIVVGNFETLKNNNHYCKLYSLAAEKGGLLEAVIDVQNIKQKMINLDGNTARNSRPTAVSDESSKLHNPIQFDLALNGRLFEFGKQVFLSSKDINVKLAKQQPKLFKTNLSSQTPKNQPPLVEQPLPQNHNASKRQES